MSLSVTCSQCGKAYKVKDELAGKAIRCRECQATIRIPAAATDEDNLDFDASELEADEPPDELPPPRSKSKPVAKPPAKKKRSSSGSSAWNWIFAIFGGVLLVGLICCGVLGFVVYRAGAQLTSGVPVPAGKSFDEWRSEFQTKLIRSGPSPQEYDPTERPPVNVTEVTYPSGQLQLKAWVYRPPGDEVPRPALVYFHGGFAFGGEDLTDSCRAFMEAGFVVMGPMLRGENGNPGNYELFLGEVDDARAACQWLAQQPYVNKDRIYTFGHSIGGGVSAVLSMLDKVPIRHGGSSGGLYDHITFTAWQLDGTVPFENSPQERSVRLLIGNTAHMQHKHYAYIGDDDMAFDDAVEAIQKESGASGKLFVERIPGDHFDSFEPSIKKYLQIVQQDGSAPPAAASASSSAAIQSPPVAPNESAAAPTMSFEEMRSREPTKLVRRGPAPQRYQPESPPPNVTEVVYPSGELQLKAWVFRPPSLAEPRPALVYFHGGFAFGASDLEDSRPFMDAGYVVMAPMLRGENGNPGNFEMYLGEVDDGRAACQWLAQQDYVDKSRIFTFGHSAGGMVSAMLSLLNDVPIRHGGSAGGLYDEQLFQRWSADIVPFENTPEERRKRTLVGNSRSMQRQHFAYVGDADAPVLSSIRPLTLDRTQKLLAIEMVPGNHFTSLAEAMKRYFAVVQRDAGP